MAAIQPIHIRSISLPPRDHSLMVKMDEELRKLKSFMAQSSLTSHMIVDGRKGLGCLYECINELLHLPSRYHNFSDSQQKWMDVELDGSIRLLDLLVTLRDCMLKIKEQIRHHEMALRRRGGAVSNCRMHTKVLSDKKSQKNIQNCFRSLKHMDDKDASTCTCDKELDFWKVINILKEARVLVIPFLQSVSGFLLMPRPNTKASRGSPYIKDTSTVCSNIINDLLFLQVSPFLFVSCALEIVRATFEFTLHLKNILYLARCKLQPSYVMLSLSEKIPIASLLLHDS